MGKVDYVAKFIAYASAFERAFETDEWDAVAACFAADAEYVVPFAAPLGGHFHGREAIVGYLRDILNRLDRRFETRTPELLSLTTSGEAGNIIQIRGRVTYTHASAPDLVFELDEVAHFEAGAIQRLEDRYDDENKKRILSYVQSYGESIGMDLRDLELDLASNRLPA